MGEFDLIEKYFTWDDSSTHQSDSASIIKGIGDDGAILKCPANQHLVTSVDTLVSGVHFPEDTDPQAIGHKALAVNLSDLAAMGATPTWFTLALTLPDSNDNWLSAFSSGLKKIAQAFDIKLIGGDTTRGPLSITINVMGFVNSNETLLRDGAKPSEKIYVTGTLGGAALGLKAHQNSLSASQKSLLNTADFDACIHQLNYPNPRIAESVVIANYASACMDISDGLLQDLSHLTNLSGTGAEIDLNKLPLPKALAKLKDEDAWSFALSGGDDYELLFTVAETKVSDFERALHHLSTPIRCIGVITSEKGKISDTTGRLLNKTSQSQGYDHFS